MVKLFKKTKETSEFTLEGKIVLSPEQLEKLIKTAQYLGKEELPFTKKTLDKVGSPLYLKLLAQFRVAYIGLNHKEQKKASLARTVISSVTRKMTRNGLWK